MKYSYDSDADVLALHMSKEPFDYAEEMGNFIVHFDKKNRPVYIEILHASKFLSEATTILHKSAKKEIPRNIQVS